MATIDFIDFLLSRKTFKNKPVNSNDTTNHTAGWQSVTPLTTVDRQSVTPSTTVDWQSYERLSKSSLTHLPWRNFQEADSCLLPGMHGAIQLTFLRV